MITSLVRSNLKKFRPYRSARSLYQSGIFFDANENPFGSIINVSTDSAINRYPDPYSLDLRKALASFLAVSKESIFVGNGSDEAIDLLIRLFVEPDEAILIIEPTYGMYVTVAKLANVEVNRFLMKKDFTFDISMLLQSITPKTKIIFCCSPNNPTGTLIPAAEIERLCRSFRGVVVVDEAYIEFASQPSLIEKMAELPNLIVLRTFSKAWGLAGARVGYVIAQKEVIEYLNRIKLPYNLSRPASTLALQALKQYPKMMKWKERIVDEREKLKGNLAKLGLAVFPSEANFLLVRCPKGSLVAKTLAEEYGIIVRDFGSTPLLKNCIRISIGTPEQNKLLLGTLTKIL